MKEELAKILNVAKDSISKTNSLHDLGLLRSRFLGKKSELMSFMQKMGSLSKEERPAFGKLINETKSKLSNLISEREKKLQELLYNKTLSAETIDLSMPGRKRNIGSLHPITKAIREIEDIFISMDFEIAEGNDIEDEFHNFDALNTPADHPARDLSDTFYIENDVLLRTHTSPVQVRVMQNHKPPIKIIAQGRCYRNENDASHSPVFHQFEALVIDDGINFANLKDILNIFVKKMFNENIHSRIRPHFFPFTEPSAEIDILCVKCLGKGCNLCKGSGWLEMGGAGMVDPNVFDKLNIDSEKYTGYAFGLGIERIAMLKYKIPDMRMLFDNDIRMLKQFSN